MDQDSPLIFPVGWALKVGYNLEANDCYIKYANEISVALKSVYFTEFMLVSLFLRVMTALFQIITFLPNA